MLEDVDGSKLVWGVIEDISNEYKRIFEALQDAYLQFDLSFHLIMVNYGAVKMFGFTTQDEIIGKSLGELFVDSHSLETIKNDLERNHTLSNQIYECVKKDGSSVWVSFNAQSIKDNKGHTISVEGVMRDITDLNRLEENLVKKSKELESSEERFRLMIDSISDTIGITDINGKIKFRSSNNEKLFGIKADTLIGENSFDFVHPDDRERLHDEFIKLINDGFGAKRTGEFTYLRKDGSAISVELEGRNMLDNHLIEGLLLTFHDITEKKATSRKIKEESEKLRALIESTENMVWVVDPVDYGLLLFNHALSHYFETGRDLTIHEGMTPSDLLPEDYAADWRKMYDKVLIQGSYKVEYKTSANNQILELSFAPVRIEKELIGISVMGQNITERKLTEIKLLAANENLNKIMNNSMFGVVTISKEKNILWANPAAVTMMGLKSAEDVVGKKCTEYFCPAHEGMCPILDEGQKVDNSEKMVRRFDGSLIPIIKSVTEIEINGENVLLETFIDITDIKKTEIELVSLKDKFVKAQDMGRFGHWSYDLETQEFTGSRVTFEIYGFDDLTRVTYDDVVNCISKWDVDRIKEKFNQLIVQGKRLDEQFEIFPIGSNVPIYVRNIADASSDENGTVFIEGVVQDISELKKMELQVLSTAKQSQRILDQLQDAYFQADIHGRFIFVNPKAVTMYGYQTVEELIGQQADTLYENTGERDRLIKDLSQNGFLTDYVVKGKRKDQTTFWVSMNVQFVKDNSGKIIGTEGLVRDISERIDLEEAIKNQRDHLIEANVKLSQRLHQSVLAISKIIEMRDVYTTGHQKRVQKLSVEITNQLGLSNEMIMNISYGALIHDIGKIYIGSDILNKPGKISNLEYQILQTHAENGFEIVKEIDFPDEIPQMILQHHERLDGSGYPNGISGDQILLESRILAVADVVESMTSHRPYRASLGLEAALDEIETYKGSRYDAEIVDVCIKLFREKNFNFTE